MFCSPKLLWDTSTSVFMMSLVVLCCNFRIRLHDECMGPSALRRDENGILVYYLWTDLSEKWVLGGTLMVRLSWNLPLIQWCGCPSAHPDSTRKVYTLLFHRGVNSRWISTSSCVCGFQNNSLNPFWNLDRFPLKQQPQMPLFKHGLVSQLENDSLTSQNNPSKMPFNSLSPEWCHYRPSIVCPSSFFFFPLIFSQSLLQTLLQPRCWKTQQERFFFPLSNHAQFLPIILFFFFCLSFSFIEHVGYMQNK